MIFRKWRGLEMAVCAVAQKTIESAECTAARVRSFCRWGIHMIVASAFVFAIGAFGCSGKQPTTPSIPPAFPAFALTDVNPHTPTSGQIVTQDRLSGPAAVVYFGWAT
jgi:hypothetical protein